MEKVTIHIFNNKAYRFLKSLEELQLIKIIKGKKGTDKTKLSDKYRGIISKEEGEKLNQHIDQMRKEWDNT
ncbi:MAG: hypothetical protein WD048_06795 [Chitinophagales bacterium]